MTPDRLGAMSTYSGVNLWLADVTSILGWYIPTISSVVGAVIVNLAGPIFDSVVIILF